MGTTIEEANRAYRIAMKDALTEAGAVFRGAARVLPRLSETCPEFRIHSICLEETQFYLTDGCHLFSDDRSADRDEFVLHEFLSQDAAIVLLNYVSFYHMTLRTLAPVDVVEIGHVDGLPQEFSHVLISVPFFLSGTLNRMEIGGLTFNLSWVMPISRREFEFISAYGADAFERRLDESSYGYFDVREDMSYLEHSAIPDNDR